MMLLYQVLEVDKLLYERYFFGPPALMASSYYDLYQKDDLIDRIDNFLKTINSYHFYNKVIKFDKKFI